MFYSSLLLPEFDHVTGNEHISYSVITSASVTGNPIAYASNNFFLYTGYSPKEVYGNDCNFLQGPDTSPEDVLTIIRGLKSQRSFQSTILNYKRDGTPFWCQLQITPLKVHNGRTLRFSAFQTPLCEIHDGAMKPVMPLFKEPLQAI